MQNISTTAMLAESSLTIAYPQERARDSRNSLDTTFVLFFLAMDLGLAGLSVELATFLQLATLIIFLLVPYFLPLTADQQSFSSWLMGRTVVTAAGVMFGSMLGQAVGTVLPDAFQFVPMTLLIVAAIICCNVQIYGILKYRLAR